MITVDNRRDGKDLALCAGCGKDRYTQIKKAEAGR